MAATSYPTPTRPGFLLPPPPPPAAYSYQYAGLFSRFGATILDFLLLLAVTVVIAVPFGLLAAAFALSGGLPGWLASLLFGPFILLMFVLWIGYFTYFEGTSGQTPGKRALGLRVVVPSTGQPPDLGHAFVRTLLRIIDWLPAFYLVGFVVALVSSRKQRLGDHLADTIVVRG